MPKRMTCEFIIRTLAPVTQTCDSSVSKIHLIFNSRLSFWPSTSPTICMPMSLTFDVSGRFRPHPITHQKGAV